MSWTSTEGRVIACVVFERPKPNFGRDDGTNDENMVG